MSNTILVVDDEESLRRLLAKIFANAGFTTRVAGSADEALALLAKEQILVMFLDLQLPGMNGMDLCRRIRKDQPVASIFALTGFASVYDLVECREAGFDDYFVKPFDPEVVVKTARDAFDRLARWRLGQKATVDETSAREVRQPARGKKQGST
ncbi:MAG: response regulator [Kiritimatiellae bacterium]|nr:response regulator [Kiritimatiellia bacterium]